MLLAKRLFGYDLAVSVETVDLGHRHSWKLSWKICSFTFYELGSVIVCVTTIRKIVHRQAGHVGHLDCLRRVIDRIPRAFPVFSFTLLVSCICGFRTTLCLAECNCCRYCVLY